MPDLHLRDNAACKRLQARVRELEGFIRLGLTVDKFNPADIAAWQRMAKVALQEDEDEPG